MANTKYTYNEKRKEWYTLVYDGTLTPTGAKHRKRISSKKSSADLEKKVVAFKQELAEGKTRPSNITFGEYAHIWLDTAKATKEQNTIKSYRSTINSGFDLINDIPLAQISHSDLQRCINAKKDYPRTCKNIASTFRQIIKSAVRDRYLPHYSIFELTEDINLPKYNTAQKRPLNDVEKKALFAADLDAKKRAFVSILYYCGMRKGEVIALTPDDFDWDAQTVSVSKAWALNAIKPYPKTQNGIRTIPIPDAAIPYIKPYVEQQQGYIFQTRYNNVMTESAYRKMWDSIIKAMNDTLEQSEPPITDLTAHIFRHNYCTELCYRVPAISTKMIARLLGDRENMVIEVYSHLVEGKEDAVTVLNDLFNL